MDQPILRRFLSYFSADSAVDEILVNGFAVVAVVSDRQTCCVASFFADDDTLIDWLHDFSVARGVRLDPLSPANGGSFVHEGQQFRWHCLLPPIAADGPIFCLRRHRFTRLELADFAITDTQKMHLQNCFEEQRNLLVVGATGAGKTSVLVAALRTFAAQERIAIIEHLPELPRLSPHWFRLVERQPNLEGIGAFSVERIFAETLRLRPDRLVIGEIRARSEARIFLQAASSGHRGACATLHAGSAAMALRRLNGLLDCSCEEALTVIMVADRKIAAIEVLELPPTQRVA